MSGKSVERVQLTLEENAVTVKKNSSLFELSNDPTSDLVFGCFSGRCGSCLIEVKEGIENLSPRTDLEDAFFEMTGDPESCRLACQCQITGNVKAKIIGP